MEFCRSLVDHTRGRTNRLVRKDADGRTNSIEWLGCSGDELSTHPFARLLDISMSSLLTFCFFFAFAFSPKEMVYWEQGLLLLTVAGFQILRFKMLRHLYWKLCLFEIIVNVPGARNYVELFNRSLY